MAFEDKYGERKIFWGDELLVFGDLGDGNTATNLQVVTGMTALSAMENEAEATNYPADDVPDHATKKGADLLSGELSLIQVDTNVKTGLLGHKVTANGYGTVASSEYPEKIVQYISPAQKKDSKGELVKGYLITVFPKMKATGEPTHETETESTDGVDPFTWTLPVQATATDKYQQDGAKFPEVAYEIWGDDATNFEAQMEAGLFIMFPDTTITGGGSK